MSIAFAFSSSLARQISTLFLCSAFALPVLAKDAALNRLLEEDWQWRLRHHPELATEFGDHRYDHLLDDKSLAAKDAEIAHDRQMLLRAKKLKRHHMNAQEQLSHQLFIYEKERDLRTTRFYAYDLYPMASQLGIHINLMQLVEKMPFQTAQDYRNLIARLQRVPAQARQTIQQLEHGKKTGWVAPRVIVQDLPQQLRELAAQLASSNLATPANQMPATLSAAQQKRFKAQILAQLEQSVKPAFLQLADYIETSYLPACRDSIAASSLPGGAAYYAEQVANHTTTDLTPQQIHEIGLQEVARIQAQMKAIMQQTGFQGDLSQFAAKLNSEPQHFYDKAEDLLQGYRDIIARVHDKLPQLFGRLPKGAVDVKAVPTVGAESQGGAYYEPGTPDGKRSGYFVANTSQLHTRPKWKMETLTMHEAEPGHHFQIALTQEIPDMPAFRRFGWYTVFGEGWALYAESLGKEMGFYSDPYALFGHLDDEIYRAARLVVDTGIHAMGWSRQQAIDYMNQNTANPPADNVVEIDRYIGWPGQALSYKIGQLKIRQLRTQAQAALGERFDIRQFHDALLANGGLPLAILEKNMQDWQAQQARK